MHPVGQRAWRLAVLPLLLPLWRSHGAEEEDAGPAVAAHQRGLRGQSWRRLTEEPEQNLTEELQALECASAYLPCDCAAVSGCRWLVFSGGNGGLCTDGDTGVSCSACDMQAACPAGRCLARASACDCVGDDDCSWDASSGTCVVDSGTMQQRCGSCPTLAVCAEAFPQAVSFDPSRGGVVDSRYVSVTFDSGLDWCAASSGSPSLWCGSRADSQIVSRDRITLEYNVLTVDISASLPTIPIGGLTCGLVISSDLLCTTSDNAAFLGLPADADYSFSVFDETGPAIIRYSPERDSYTVPTDGWITLSFSERIFKPGGGSGDVAVQATLGRLSMDWSGANTGQVEAREEVQAEIAQETNRLRVPLAGLVRSDIWYTLSVPAASLADASGNSFAGLREGAYAFRVAGEVVAQSTAQAEFVEASDGLSTGAAVGIAAAVFGLCSMAAFWLRRRVHALEALRVHGLRHAADPEVPAKVRVPKAVATNALEGPAASALPGPGINTPPPGVAWQHPGADDATMWARPSERRPGADAAVQPGDGPSPSSAEGTRAASPRPTPGIPSRDERPWEDRSRRAPSEKGAPTAAAAGQGQPPPRQPPAGGGARIGEPPRAQARQARQEARSASHQPPLGGGAEPQQDPRQTTAVCPPEAKSVESKLRSTMGAPLEERKKVYKALLLEYHPDKNSDPGAKEVFQYVNGARDWFLHVPS